MSKKSRPLLVFVGVALVVYALLAVFVPSVRPSLSQASACERTLLDLEGQTFSSTEEVQSATGLSDSDFAQFVSTFDVKVEDGKVTACPLEPEVFS